MKEVKPMHQKKFQIDEKRNARLKRSAKKENKSEGQIIREGLDKYFESVK